MTAPDHVSWVMNPLRMPAMKSAWYRAVGTCSHGSTVHRVIAPKPELVSAAVPALTPAHHDETGCRCPTGELQIRDEEVDP